MTRKTRYTVSPTGIVGPFSWWVFAFEVAIFIAFGVIAIGGLAGWL